MEQKVMDRIDTVVEQLAPDLKKLALDIHGNPELGHQEVKACQWQVELLEKYGFTVEKNFCGMATSYKAVYQGKKSGPRIAMLAEYDALPEIGHACGHNLIAMMSVGSGIAMREFADEYGAEITVIGTPAEETAGGKVEMSRKGAFKGYDAVMWRTVSGQRQFYQYNWPWSAELLNFFGRTAHAAAWRRKRASMRWTP